MATRNGKSVLGKALVSRRFISSGRGVDRKDGKFCKGHTVAEVREQLQIPMGVESIYNVPRELDH